MSKIVVDTIESTGATVTVNDALTTGTNAITSGAITATGAISAGTNAITAGSITGLSATSITSGTLPDAILNDDAFLQIVKATSTSSTYGTTQDTWIEGGVTGTITLSSTDSRVLVMCMFNGYISQSGADDRVLTGGKYGIQRSVSGGTDTDDCLGTSMMAYPLNDARSYGYLWGQWGCPMQIIGIDEPSHSTSAITYKLQWNYSSHADGTSNMGLHYSSQIILIELKG